MACPALPRCLERGVPYEPLFWVIYGALMAWWILDRFAGNLWPRDNFSIGAGSAGKDFAAHSPPWTLLEGPWTVQFYDAWARISGRYSILALNVLFLTRMPSLYRFLQESTTLNRFVDFSRCIHANERIHRINGWVLLAAILLHVYSILLPSLLNGYSAEVVTGSFEWPLSERKPKHFQHVNVEQTHVMLQADDVYRIVLMTLLLAVLLPLSIRWMHNGSYHVGVVAHSFIGIMFFIDMVRRHTHPHSWLLNTPFFVFWIGDRLVSRYWRCASSEITACTERLASGMRRIMISEDYMCLCWNSADTEARPVACEYFFRIQASGWLERAHPFECVVNRCGVALPGTSEIFTNCVVVKVYRNHRALPLGSRDRKPHTARLCDLDERHDGDGTPAMSTVHRWGPFPGAISNELSRDLHEGLTGKRTLVVIAGGSGIAVILDTLQLICLPGPLHQPDTHVLLIYSTRDAKLYDWAMAYAGDLLQKAPEQNRRRLSMGRVDVEDTDATAAAAASLDLEGTPKAEAKRRREKKRRRTVFAPIFTGDGSDICMDLSSRAVHTYQGRQQLVDVIPCDSKVYAVGGGGLLAAVQSACADNACELVTGSQHNSSTATPLRRAAVSKVEPKAEGHRDGQTSHDFDVVHVFTSDHCEEGSVPE